MPKSHNKRENAVSTSKNRACTSFETTAYSLRPRKNGQVVPPNNTATVMTSRNLCSLSLDSLNPDVVLEDISDICATVQSSELDDPVSNHSVDPLLAKDRGALSALPERLPILWPSMNDDSKWNSLNEAITKHLSSASKNLAVGSRIQYLEMVIYECASAAFGHSVPSVKHLENICFRRKERTIELVKAKNHLLHQM